MGSIYAYWLGEAGDELSSKNVIYIGKTSRPAKERFAAHTAKWGEKAASLFEQKVGALLDDGKSVAHKTIESNVTDSELGAREKHYIAHFQTHTSQGGFNETWGG